MSTRAVRVGVVGASRRRGGTGEHIARFLHAAGAKVDAVAGTSLATAEEAAARLREKYGIVAKPYPDAAAMVEQGSLEALVVATPDETHEGCLDLALGAGLHTLCEKPLVYGPADFVERGELIVRAFFEKRLCLSVATQWRHALPAYMRLFPAVTPRTSATFSMRLSPSPTGQGMVPAAMPHPLSLLDHLYPAEVPGLREIEVERPSDDEARVKFVHPGRGVRCDVHLVRGGEQPRTLSFGFDGQIATRVVREPGYRTALRAEGSGREIELPDPMETLAKHFLERVRKGPPFLADPAVPAGLHHLRDVLDAFGRDPGPSA